MANDGIVAATINTRTGDWEIDLPPDCDESDLGALTALVTALESLVLQDEQPERAAS